jgi:hypothetical protein
VREVPSDQATNAIAAEGRLVVVVMGRTEDLTEVIAARRIAHATFDGLGPDDLGGVVFAAGFYNAGETQSFTADRARAELRAAGLRIGRAVAQARAEVAKGSLAGGCCLVEHEEDEHDRTEKPKGGQRGKPACSRAQRSRSSRAPAARGLTGILSPARRFMTIPWPARRT